MRWIKIFISNIHRYILWALISVFLWAWIFSFRTDTVPKRKVTVFLHTPSLDDTALEAELSRGELPDGIRLVKVHPLSYAVFGTAEIDLADILILPEREVGQNLSMLCPVPADLFAGIATEVFESGGECYGFRVFDGTAGKGGLSGFAGFVPDEEQTVSGGDEPKDVFFPGESYYLCFGIKSLHLGELNGSGDDAALTIANRLLRLP